VRLALVHDWLHTWGGSESVLQALCTMFPDADLYALVDFLPGEERARLRRPRIATTPIQSLPFARRHFRAYLPLFPWAMRQLDLSRYDVVLSNSHAIANFVRCRPTQMHLSYCHTPMRYAWDLREEYLSRSRLGRGPFRWAARWQLERLRLADLAASAGVDLYAANSRNIAKRIARCYGRSATVIYPPVDTGRFVPGGSRDDYYVTVSRLVPYKRVDVLVEAFRTLAPRRLVVLGTGPELAMLRGLAGDNVTLLEHVPAASLLPLLQRARAFLFAANEDFGIAPLEAQSCGLPVIAFRRGGVAETVIGLDGAAPTGVFFAEQSPAAVVRAVFDFEANAGRISAEACRSNALRFSQERFRVAMQEFVAHAWTQFECGRSSRSGQIRAHAIDVGTRGSVHIP
jgi:glycosyltransferase involved in cell wall biosynthesis